MIAVAGVSGAPVLETDRLLLRPLVDSDAPAIARGAGDPRVARYLVQVPSPYPVGLARRWLRGRNDWWRTGRGVTLAVADRSAPRALVGTVSLRRQVRDRRAELGYWLATEAWGAGVATEAAVAMVRFGFEEMGLARIFAQVMEGNTASLRVLEKLGLRMEGLLRKHVRKDRRYCDLYLYGMLRDEYREHVS